MSLSLGALWWILMCLAFVAGSWWGASRQRAKDFIAREQEARRRAQFGDRR